MKQNYFKTYQKYVYNRGQDAAKFDIEKKTLFGLCNKKSLQSLKKWDFQNSCMKLYLDLWSYIRSNFKDRQVCTYNLHTWNTEFSY